MSNARGNGDEGIIEEPMAAVGKIGLDFARFPVPFGETKPAGKPCIIIDTPS
jgi:hypothetical protein